MRALLLAAALLAALPGVPRAQASKDAFSDFKSRFRSPAFSESRLSPQGNLELWATDLYLSSGTSRQSTWVAEAFHSWREALNAAGTPREHLLASVVWSGGGTLWRGQPGKVSRVAEWSDDRIQFDDTRSPRGRVFAFFGGQMVTGGDVDATGFNARVGSTLLQDRYDAAATLSYATLDTNPSVKINSFGVVGRALYPLTDHVGYNLGLQLTRADADGEVDFTLGAVAGLNFYMPSGSFDLTLSLQDAGSWSLLAGYTVFFTRR